MVGVSEKAVTRFKVVVGTACIHEYPRLIKAPVGAVPRRDGFGSFSVSLVRAGRRYGFGDCSFAPVMPLAWKNGVFGSIIRAAVNE